MFNNGLIVLITVLDIMQNVNLVCVRQRQQMQL